VDQVRNEMTGLGQRINHLPGFAAIQRPHHERIACLQFHPPRDDLRWADGNRRQADWIPCVFDAPGRATIGRQHHRRIAANGDHVRLARGDSNEVDTCW